MVIDNEKKRRLIVIFGERSKSAREIIGFNLDKASKIIGYGNSTKLSKVERATNQTSVSMWLAYQLANTYKVSLDYLMGLTDNFDKDEVDINSIRFQSWYLDLQEKWRYNDIIMFKKMATRLNAIEELAVELAKANKELNSIFLRFKSKNSTQVIYEENTVLENGMYEDLLVVSNLEKQVNYCNTIALKLSENLNELKLNCNVETESKQISLLD